VQLMKELDYPHRQRIQAVTEVCVVCVCVFVYVLHMCMYCVWICTA